LPRYVVHIETINCGSIIEALTTQRALLGLVKYDCIDNILLGNYRTL